MVPAEDPRAGAPPSTTSGLDVPAGGREEACWPGSANSSWGPRARLTPGDLQAPSWAILPVPERPALEASELGQAGHGVQAQVSLPSGEASLADVPPEAWPEGRE